MSARVFIHPACSTGTVRFVSLCDGITALGYDLEKLSIEHRGLGLMDQLVRILEVTPTRKLYQRFDGTKFSKEITDAPEQVRQ